MNLLHLTLIQLLTFLGFFVCPFTIHAGEKEFELVSTHGDGKIRCVALSSDGRLVAIGHYCAGDDGATIEVWNTITNEHKYSWNDHRDHVLCMSFSPQGDSLLSGSTDGDVCLKSLKSKTLDLVILRSHEDPVYDLAFAESAKVFVTASQDGTVRVWNSETKTTTRILEGLDVNASLSLSKDGSRIALSGWSEECILFTINDDDVKKHTLKGHRHKTHGITMSPDGRTIISGDESGDIIIWNPDALTPDKRLSLGRAVAKPLLSPNGKLLAAGTSAGEIIIFDTKDYTKVGAIKPPTAGRLHSMSFNADGTVLAAVVGESAYVWRRQVP